MSPANSKEIPKRKLIPLGSIRQRLIVISLLPVLIITIFLIWFMVSERFSDLEQALDQLGHSSASYIAATAEVSMYASDSAGLRQLAQDALQIRQATAVIFIDNTGNEISSQGQFSGLQYIDLEYCLSHGHWRADLLHYYCQPVATTALMISDYAEEQTPVTTAEQYGWVVLVLSAEQAQQQRHSIVLFSSAVSIVGMIASMLLALRIGRSISQPIQQLTQTVKNLEVGESTDIDSNDGPQELRALSASVHRLAVSVGEAQGNLESKVASATSALTETLNKLGRRNRELESTRDDLQQAMTAKDQFLARMSHELRTPLTTVTGFANLLNRGTLKPEQREYSNHILHASSLLLSTIDDILNHSKLQANALLIEKIEFNLHDCIESLVALYAQRAYQKSLELVLIIDHDVPHRLIGDPTRLKQIIGNLMANAIKFTEHGEVVIKLSVADEPPIDNEIGLIFQIRDSGIGMDKEQLAKLFKPFSQADESITRRYGGSGLGLIICKQLIELMQGRIDVDSRPGDGCEIEFHLNFGCSHQRQQNRDETTTPPCAILSYDSNSWSRRAIRTQLARWNHRVITVNDYRQLQQHLQQQKFSLLVLGVNRRELEQLPRQIAELRRHYPGPILLLACIEQLQTSLPTQLFEDYGPLHCLSKPARRHSLLTVINNLHSDDRAGRMQHSEANPSQKLLTGISILVAEDNHYNRQLISTVIAGFGADVFEASDGRQAVELFKQRRCDIVLMDVHMPVLDGITACKEINQLSAGSGVGIFALTANVIENEKQQLMKSGALGIFYKPLDENKLITGICQYLGRQWPVDSHVKPLASQSSIFGSDANSRAQLQRELKRLCIQTRQACDNSDTATMRESVHELLGLAGLFGMQSLQKEVEQLQRMIIDGELDQCHFVIERIAMEVSAMPTVANT